MIFIISYSVLAIASGLFGASALLADKNEDVASYGPDEIFTPLTWFNIFIIFCSGLTVAIPVIIGFAILSSMNDPKLAYRRIPKTEAEIKKKTEKEMINLTARIIEQGKCSLDDLYLIDWNELGPIIKEYATLERLKR